MGDIASGDITEHFKTETLATIRKKYRIEKQELEIRRWTATQDVNRNRIMEVYETYLPWHSLLDNPRLTEIVHEIEDEENIGFFGALEFEESLMEFFDRLSFNQV